MEKLVLRNICAFLPSGWTGKLSFGGNHGALKGQNKGFWLQRSEEGLAVPWEAWAQPYYLALLTESSSPAEDGRESDSKQ